MVGLQVGPEQLPEQVGEALQRGKVHRWLAFTQVVDQNVTNRAARDPVTVDQLLAGRLPAAGEHLDRGGGILAQDTMAAQQLVEQRAVGMHLGRGTHPGGDLQKFNAVTDLHRGGRPALGGEDDRDPGQGLLPALQSDPALRAQPSEQGERRAVAGAGHLGGQATPRRGEAQQPAQAGPDHVSADQHQQPRAQVRQLCPGGRSRSRPARRRVSDQIPPVGLVLGAAGLPPLLPAITGVSMQPGQHRQHPQPAGLLADRVIQRERRGQDPGQHRGPARLRHRPRRRDRAGRERGQQLRPCRLQPRRRRRSPGGRCRDHLLAADGHEVLSPNRICRLSGRYPGAGSAAGPRSRRRAWKASTPVITSSVTGFR